MDETQARLWVMRLSTTVGSGQHWACAAARADVRPPPPARTRTPGPARGRVRPRRARRAARRDPAATAPRLPPPPELQVLPLPAASTGSALQPRAARWPRRPDPHARAPPCCSGAPGSRGTPARHRGTSPKGARMEPTPRRGPNQAMRCVAAVTSPRGHCDHPPPRARSPHGSMSRSDIGERRPGHHAPPGGDPQARLLVRGPARRYLRGPPRSPSRQPHPCHGAQALLAVEQREILAALERERQL